MMKYSSWLAAVFRSEVLTEAFGWTVKKHVQKAVRGGCFLSVFAQACDSNQIPAVEWFLFRLRLAFPCP